MAGVAGVAVVDREAGGRGRNTGGTVAVVQPNRDSGRSQHSAQPDHSVPI